MTPAFPKPVRVRKPPKRLTRSGPPRRKRKGGPRRGAPKKNPAFLSWLHEMGICAAAPLDIACSAGRQVHHVTFGRGLSQKSRDLGGSFLFCDLHHDEFHGQRGVFADMDKQARRDWQAERAAEAGARYLAAGSRRTGG